MLTFATELLSFVVILNVRCDFYVKSKTVNTHHHSKDIQHQITHFTGGFFHLSVDACALLGKRSPVQKGWQQQVQKN